MKYRKRSLGLAFKDELIKVRTSSGHFFQKQAAEGWEELLLPNFKGEETNNPPNSWRLVVVSVVFLIIFFGLFLRVFHLQVVSGDQYRLMADTNRIQIRVIHAPRGVIFDRNGKILAENNPAFRLNEEIVTRDKALEMEAKGEPKFAELEIDAIRYYPQGVYVSHILGYVGQITQEELDDPNYRNYRTGDRLGRAGIEQVYEEVLKGKDGAEVIEVDAQGRKLRTIRKIDPIPGKNLHLSIDTDLQKTAFQSLESWIKKADKSCCGAAIAIDPKNGEILAMVSIPSFDANAFTDPEKQDKISEYFQNNDAPLLNRAISGNYPPGSTFKITSSFAGLSSGKITKTTKIEDTGFVTLGPFKFNNWYFTYHGKTDGLVDVVKALQRSNDIFYYRLGEMVGEEKIAQTAESLGMGKKLGIDLTGESEGLIPSDKWKREKIGEGWYPGDTLHFAIGQGFLLTTPLQILAQTSYVAGEGNLEHPHLVTKVTDSNGNLVKKFEFQPLVSNLYKKEDIELVKKGLEAVTKPGGTAWPFFTFSVPTAGKTGTAEFGDSKGKTHAWYTGYAPVDDPTIVATALIEAGGEGSSVSAPVVKDIFTWYFNTDKTNIKSLDSAPVATDSVRLRGE